MSPNTKRRLVLVGQLAAITGALVLLVTTYYGVIIIMSKWNLYTVTWEVPYSAPAMPNWTAMPKITVLNEDKNVSWRLRGPVADEPSPLLTATTELKPGAYDFSFAGDIKTRDGKTFNLVPDEGSFFSVDIYHPTNIKAHLVAYPPEPEMGGGHDNPSSIGRFDTLDDSTPALP